MVIVGSKGFAKEILEVVLETESSNKDSIAFFDNVNLVEETTLLFSEFQVLSSFDEVELFFKSTSDKRFSLGIGSPESRKELSKTFNDLGGINTTFVSKNALVGSYETIIGEGTQIMQGSIVTNNVTIGNSCLINLNCTIGHDSTIGDFTELSPAVNISGRCSIGNLVSIGTGAVVLPDVVIGDNVIIGAGAVVTKDISSNTVAVGIPAKVIKRK